MIPPPSRRRTTPPPPRVRFCKNKYNSYLVRVSIGMISCRSTGFGYSRMVWTAVVSSAILPRTVFNARRCTSFSPKNVGFITELCFPNCGHGHFGCQSYILLFITRLLELDPSFVNLRCIIYRHRHCAMRVPFLGLRACHAGAFRTFKFAACPALGLLSTGATVLFWPPLLRKHCGLVPN